MSKGKHSDAATSKELLNDAAELLQPRDLGPAIVTPAIPLQEVVAGTAVLAAARKQVGIFKPCPEWSKLREALNARDKALAKYHAAWYETAEGKRLEAAADQARAAYFKARTPIS